MRKANIAERSYIGELGFFLGTARSATIQTKSHTMLFFLSSRYKRHFLRKCPKISKRMKKMMYLYVNSDETLRSKVRLLRDNVYYLETAEKRSLIELAMQMLSRAYKETT